jgi:hypothetical protein
VKTIIILEDFTGYPQGAKQGSLRQEFEKGQEIEVTDAFAELVIGKGHAKEKAGGEAKDKKKAKESEAAEPQE